MMRLINVLVITGLLIVYTSFSGTAQNFIVNCELSTSFTKQIKEWNKRFKDKTKFEIVLCEEAIGTYTKCITELTASGFKCQTKDSLLVYLHKMLGNTFRYGNDNFSALTHYKTAIDISEKCNNCNLIQKAHAMFNLAKQKRLYKDFSSSEQYFLASNHIYIKEFGKYDFLIGLELLTTYQYWGYPIGHPKLDSIYYLLNDLYDKDTTRDIRINYLAEKHIKNKKHDEAHQIYDEALNFYLTNKKYFNWIKVNLLKIDLLIKQNRLNEVQPILNAIQDVALKHELNLNLHHLKADLLLTKATFNIAQQQYTHALINYQKVLQFINPLFTYQTIYQNPSPNQIFGNPYLLTTLADKAEVFKKMYHQSGEIKNLKHALDCYQLSYTAADEMRKNYSFEEANTYLSSYTYSYFEKAIALCQQLAITYPEQESYYQQKAFEIAQRSSMKTLFWEINSRRADYHSLDDSTKTKKKRLQTNLVSLEDQLKNEPDNNNLKTQRFETRQALDRINQQLRNNIDGYANDQFCHFSDLSIEQKTIQNNLFPNEALLNYFMGDSLIYCFLATEENFQIVEIENPEFVAEQVFAFRRKIEESPVTKDLGYLLYKQLLENVLARLSPKINNLIIVPDGILSALPFEALQKSNQYHDFLINDYTISYDLHSYFLGQRKNNISPDKVNAVGFSVEDFSNWGRIRLPSLPYAKEEIESLIKNVGGKPYHLATKQQFLLHFQKPQIVHISSHAQADTIEASNSCIYFTQISNNESEDILTRNEILNYSCNAEMIVLSACETGLGKHNKGEGITSLARAFRTIGSKSEVMSLWKIGDNTTFKIITDFYKFLKEGDPKNKALRKAKINYLNNQSSIDHKMSPKNWAGLVLQGNVEPLF